MTVKVIAYNRYRNGRRRSVRGASLGQVLKRGFVERRLLPIVASDGSPPAEPRPRLRSECINGPRPCPFVGCRWNLYLDVSRFGTIKLNFPDLEPGEMPPNGSCALDVADEGVHTHHDVGALMNLTRARVQQIEYTATVKVRALAERHAR